MQAQSMDSLLGKIVRINTDGSIPKDNPFVGKEGVRPEIWSIGHRNIQAATLHPTTGELWEVEHGTRGGDEINIARKGKDYGWPTIAYGIEYRGGPITGGIPQKDGMEQPLYYWDPVIGPSGMAFYTGTCSRRGRATCSSAATADQRSRAPELKGDKVVGEERLLKDLKKRGFATCVRPRWRALSADRGCDQALMFEPKRPDRASLLDLQLVGDIAGSKSTPCRAGPQQPLRRAGRAFLQSSRGAPFFSLDGRGRPLATLLVSRSAKDWVESCQSRATTASRVAMCCARSALWLLPPPCRARLRPRRRRAGASPALKFFPGFKPLTLQVNGVTINGAMAGQGRRRCCCMARRSR